MRAKLEGFRVSVPPPEGLVGLAAVLFLVIACDAGDDGSGGQGYDPGEHEVVEIPASGVEIGFATGVQRDTKTLQAFSVSRHPVTQGEFRACVDAGVCSHASAPRCHTGSGNLADYFPGDAGVPANVPATCVGVDQAENYCRWAGGALPTLEQWMLAARGPDVVRFSWGSKKSTCDLHPGAVKILPRGAAEGLVVAQGLRLSFCEGSNLLNVGRHEAGASPFGVEDVLLARAELLRGSEDNLFGACDADAAVPGACLVYGLDPGAIDSVQRLTPGRESDAPSGQLEVAPKGYAFRCVWNEEI